MKKHPSRDFVAEAITEYEAMPVEERSELLLNVLDDQPYLMGFVTNLADDFSDSAHEALVESSVILINAFIAAGIPVGVVPMAIIEEVIEEKVEAFEKQEEENISDSPLVFDDLMTRAIIHSDLKGKDALAEHNFKLVLLTIVTTVERSVSVEINSKSN